MNIHIQVLANCFYVMLSRVIFYSLIHFQIDMLNHTSKDCFIFFIFMSGWPISAVLRILFYVKNQENLLVTLIF